MKPTNLKYTINSKDFNVFVKQGASRKTYFIWFKSIGFHLISGKECTIK